MKRVCPGCTTEQTPTEFRRHAGRGGRPSVICNWCFLTRPEHFWCWECGWQPRALFYMRSATRPHERCRPCFLAHRHGTTVLAILERQGSAAPECAACGGVADLQVHHDHSCCPGPVSCGACVEGYLCRGCNVAEGWLRSSDQAYGLAAFMATAELRRWHPDTRPVRVA